MEVSELRRERAPVALAGLPVAVESSSNSSNILTRRTLRNSHSRNNINPLFRYKTNRRAVLWASCNRLSRAWASAAKIRPNLSSLLLNNNPPFSSLLVLSKGKLPSVSLNHRRNNPPLPKRLLRLSKARPPSCRLQRPRPTLRFRRMLRTQARPSPKFTRKVVAIPRRL